MNVSPYLKKDAPVEFVECVRHIEERADSCYASLALLETPSNVALWGLLLGGVKAIEQAIEKFGDNCQDFDAALLNVSRSLPIAMKWIADWGKRASKLAQQRWTPVLARRVDEAFSRADEYSGFIACLPMWHRNRYHAELYSPTKVRFTAAGCTRQRQVSAFLKSFRPTTGTSKVQRSKKPEQTPQVQELFASVLEAARKTGSLRFEYDAPWNLWYELLSEYQARVVGITRRPDSLSLGRYTLGEFKQFYAALLTVCASHEFLCFAWGNNIGNYPLDSAILIRSESSWIDVLSKLSGLTTNVCQSAINDLMFDFGRSIDLHVHPFVALDRSGMRLAVAPQFPLHSLPDENILRVCSQLRQAEFDVTSLEKEAEMLDTLQRRCGVFRIQGPIPLPSPLPDIDVVVTDEVSSTVIFAETKWIRKTLRPVEVDARDADVLKGVTQLKRIREFVKNHPGHLHSQGSLARQVSEYENVYYLLVARDHWLWVEPKDEIAIVEFEAFTSALARVGDLNCAIRELLRYDWLPVEGRDFRVQYVEAATNGVAIESELFFATT